MTVLTDVIPSCHQPCGCAQVAVYGTLRRGGSNDIRHWQPDVHWLGHCWLQGQLYDFGRYPGLVLDGARPVLAEVYALTDALERELDQLEEVWPEPNGEYAKRIVEVLLQPLAGGELQPMQVLVYEAQPAAVRGRAQIDAHDWLAWQVRRQAGQG